MMPGPPMLKLASDRFLGPGTLPRGFRRRSRTAFSLGIIFWVVWRLQPVPGRLEVLSRRKLSQRILFRRIHCHGPRVGAPCGRGRNTSTLGSLGSTAAPLSPYRGAGRSFLSSGRWHAGYRQTFARYRGAYRERENEREGNQTNQIE